MQVIMRFSMIILFFFSLAHAGQVSEKGMAESPYVGFGPSKDLKRDVLAKAKLNALDRYVSQQGMSLLKNYEIAKSDIEKNIDGYIISYVLLSEDTNKDFKTYKVVVRADINATALDAKLNASSAIANTSSSERSYISFVFVARHQAEIKQFDDRVYKRVDSDSKQAGAEHEQGSRSGLEYAAQKSTSDSITTGGSTTSKSNQVTYSVASSQTINVAMNEVFSSNDFEVVEAEYLEEESGGLISVQSFVDDYSTGNDVSPETQRNAVKGAQMLEIPYFALGTLDIGMRQTDDATGLQKVFVTVTGKVLDLRGRFPKTLASVGPVQFAGLGPNEDVAKNNALKQAAQSAASELVQQLNAKGTY